MSRTAPSPNAVKYLTWHRPASSPSSSRNPLGPTSEDKGVDNNTDLFKSTCTNSGDHALTLHRLYAWERKLYDEVKVTGLVLCPCVRTIYMEKYACIYFLILHPIIINLKLHMGSN